MFQLNARLVCSWWPQCELVGLFVLKILLLHHEQSMIRTEMQHIVFIVCTLESEFEPTTQMHIDGGDFTNLHVHVSRQDQDVHTFCTATTPVISL